MTSKGVQGETFAIPISNGIFAHRERIGAAVWVFLWLIDRTTKEVATADGYPEGLVFGGKAVRAQQIAQDLEMATRTVHAHLEQLVGAGYLRRIDYGVGLPSGYAVARSKKWRQNPPSTEPATPSQIFADPRRKTAGGSPNSALPPQISARGSQNSAPYKEDITRTINTSLNLELENHPTSLRSSTSGREEVLVRDEPVIHEETSPGTDTVALPKEFGSATDNLCLVPPPVHPPVKSAKKTKAKDPRFEPFRAALERDWKTRNPGLPFLWNGGDGAILNQLLSAGEFSLEQFEICLANRARSENPGANLGHRPRAFLANILTYSRGALDQYGHLKTSQRLVPTSTSGKSLAEQNTEYILEKEAALLRAERSAKVAHA